MLKNENVIKPDYYVVPGATGPHFTVSEGKLAVTNFNPTYPPYTVPKNRAEWRINDYDAVVISALGYVHASLKHVSPITQQGYVAEFLPRKTRPYRPMISRSCLADMMRPTLMRQTGFKFLKTLVAEFKGRILVQPFPYLSSSMAEHEDWQTRQHYEDYLGFNRFLFGLRDAALCDICDELGVSLLGSPDPAWAKDAFTPHELMKSDGQHTQPAYGAMVIRQITEHLKKG